MDLVGLHSDFLEYFDIEKGRTQRTLQSYKYNFVYFLEWLKKQGLPLDVSSIGDYQILRRFMYSMNGKVDKQTIRQRMLSLKSFCKYLVREDVLQRNPFDKFDIPKKEKSLPKPLNDDVRDKLLTFTKKRFDKTGDIRDLQVVVVNELGFKSGFRKGAMRSMVWEKTDLKKGFAFVIDKGQKEKCYPLTSSTIHYLKLLKLVRGVDKGHVLLSPKSKTPISATSLDDEFRRYLVMAGFKRTDASLHRLRHTFGTNLNDKGLGLREIQEAMGHEDIGSTVGYLHVSKKKLREKITRAFRNAK